MTIVEAAEEALKSLGGGPATVRQIYDEIVRRSLYSFGAKNPVSVLSGTIREATEGSSRLKGTARFVTPSHGCYSLKP